MDNDTNLLSRLLTPEKKAEMDRSYEAFLRDSMSNQNQNRNLRVLPPRPSRQANLSSDFEMDESERARLQERYLKSLQRQPKPAFLPPKTLRCANVQVSSYKACEEPGTMACSACKLVSYCTKECQQTHWRFHKRDCKNFMRSNDWKPVWVLENRLPSFLAEDTENVEGEYNEFSVGISLWGNTPAMDVINLSCNEKDTKMDFSLAFIASGDLRHIIQTINALPTDYSGKLDLLVNDITLPLVCRNIILLLILGTMSDEAMAVDIALHFWYSAFMPAEYNLQISLVLVSFLQQVTQGSFIIPLGPRSSMSCSFPEGAKDHFLHFISDSISMTTAQDEYDRVRTAPSRCDLRDRVYLGLKPSHRVAFQEFRRFGIVLPFGAMNAHFNCPNHSLFSREGKWLQTDYADPLKGWDLDAIIKIGVTCGTRPEDIYGCFYFFISEQLREFSQRLRKFKISSKLFCLEACNLASAICEGDLTDYGVPASLRFDRIEVSNILDANYVGMRTVLKHWAPLLAENLSAAIIGYFMNWTMLQKDGHSLTNKAVTADLIRLYNKRFPNNELVTFGKVYGRAPSPRDLESIMYQMANDMNALHENSVPFMTFLRKQGLEATLRTTKLRLREIHSIFPHRMMAPLNGLPNALPVFSNDESWYYWTKMTCSSWSERFVEFSR